MDPLTPAGHRRRRSSLMNPVGGASGSGRSSRPRGQSIRSQAEGLEDSKILEEGNTDAGALRPHDRSDDSLSDEDLHDDEETGLTTKDKRRKKQKKRRNTLLDQRIVKESVTEEEKREADRNVLRRSLINVTLIGLWYFFSLSISIYNKWMFDSSKLNFPFPMFTTSVHMLVQFSLASLVLYLIPSLRPRHGHKSDMGQSRHETELDNKTPLMTKMFYLTRIGPCGAATGLDIGLGNTSLKFITLTFYTMCKSSALAFVLLFAFIFRLETPSWKLVGVIATMTVGVIMMVAGEVEFSLLGFILVISAAFFSGFRWGLTQILLLRNPATSNPFSSIFFLAPVMFVTLFSIAIPVEGFPALIEGVRGLVAEWGPFLTPLLILFPGTIAFLMTASEFALLQRTSVVTLSIAGIFKEAVTITASLIVFGDTLTPVNVSGLFVTLGSIAAYNYIKITKMRQEAQEAAHREHIEALNAFSSSSNSGSGSDEDGEHSGEEAGLLRRSLELEDAALFTAEGDMIPRPSSVPLDHGKDVHRRED
ncbi:TPT-domain-containing protein [Coniochaeta hoffmannii]|uniref:TPT-domain-containing protein n=1 Tax=Coniochaeta hoffmannii TaxID=91930 RepID=A0AA38SAQ7_9PEZI|nr:TPT-domain-containing protein [Coniochaeta hoffmannii]